MSLYDCRKCGRINVSFDHSCDRYEPSVMEVPVSVLIDACTTYNDFVRKYCPSGTAYANVNAMRATLHSVLNKEK
jgi:hypothetical protein